MENIATLTQKDLNNMQLKMMRAPSHIPIGFIFIFLLIAVMWHKPALSADLVEGKNNGQAPDEIISVGSIFLGADNPISTTELTPREIESYRAVDLPGVLKHVASANVTTNSRGETLVFLRGSAERQTAIYYAGAPINIPWDNRIDLSLLPNSAISRLSISPGTSSVLSGSDAAGGVIDITPKKYAASLPVEVNFAKGEYGLVDIGASLPVKVGGAGIVLSGGRTRSDGSPLPRACRRRDDDKNGRGNTRGLDPVLQLNTDRSRNHFSSQLDFKGPKSSQFSASFIGVQSAYGIAPETTCAPSPERVRHWRYPDTQSLTGIVNAKVSGSEDAEILGTLWAQRFNQTIESYESDDYRKLEDVQLDRDRSYGLRLIGRRRWGNQDVRGAITVIESRHHQTDTAFEGNANAATESQREFFRRRTVSAGLETERYFGDLKIVLGGGLDTALILASGGRESVKTYNAWNSAASLTQKISPNLTISLAAARRARIPTQRELFGVALDRFLLNSDLKPESSLLTELALDFETDTFRIQAAPFANFSKNTIDQESVTIDGQTLRRRINISGSKALGFELAGAASLSEQLSLYGNVSYLHLRRNSSGDNNQRFISERPNLLANLLLEYQHDLGFGLRLGSHHRGRAYSLLPNNQYAPLSRSTTFDTEIFMDFERVLGVPAKAYFRIDNLSDTFVEPQRGLPADGRRAKIGIIVKSNFN